MKLPHVQPSPNHVLILWFWLLSLCLLYLPQNALAQADPFNCARFTTCLDCLNSNTCGWAEGTRCVSGCPGASGCVTPFYGGLTNKPTICALPEALTTFPTSAACTSYRTCYFCLSNKQCAWINGNTCTTSCTGQNCLQSNYNGAISTANAQYICTLPPAFPTTTTNIPEPACSNTNYPSCVLCIGSEHCAWQNGNTCVSNCQGGQPCVTPNYGGLADTTTNPDFTTGKAAICNLPEGRGLPSTLLRAAGTTPDKTPLGPANSPSEEVNTGSGGSSETILGFLSSAWPFKETANGNP